MCAYTDHSVLRETQAVQAEPLRLQRTPSRGPAQPEGHMEAGAAAQARRGRRARRRAAQRACLDALHLGLQVGHAQLTLADLGRQLLLLVGQAMRGRVRAPVRLPPARVLPDNGVCWGATLLFFFTLPASPTALQCNTGRLPPRWAGVGAAGAPGRRRRRPPARPPRPRQSPRRRRPRARSPSAPWPPARRAAAAPPWPARGALRVNRD